MFSVIFVLGLLYHTYTDMKSMLLYDKVTLILAAVGLVRAWYEGQLFEQRCLRLIQFKERCA